MGKQFGSAVNWAPLELGAFASGSAIARDGTRAPVASGAEDRTWVSCSSSYCW